MWLLLLACGGSTPPTGSATTPVPTAVPTPAPTPAPHQPARAVQLFGPTVRDGLRIVLHHRPGTGPSPGALALLEDALDRLVASGHIDKPGGIQVVRGEELSASSDPNAVRTFSELDGDLEGVRGDYLTADATVIHGLYTDGSYEGDNPPGRVLGFAYGGAKLVMMRDAIDSGCDDPTLLLVPGGPQAACDALEGSVLLHELGHLFGLVDNGLSMVNDHKDPDHGAHDDNEDCLMYWTAETEAATTRIADFLTAGGSQLPSFDAECLADMANALE